MSWIT